MTRLKEISRGVTDAAATAEFYACLLDVQPDEKHGRFQFTLSGGDLVVHGNPDVPVAVSLSGADAPFRGADPDGVPVVALPTTESSGAESSPKLDHVRLNCAELATAAAFYKQLGFSLTWSGRDDIEVNGPQLSALAGATWMHLSCEDGYVSLSQADWKDYGVHSPASGPPRFIHIGLAVDDLGPILRRLDRAGTTYVRGTPAVGRNVYVNDPDGVPELGTNVEIIEYLPSVQRSGAGHTAAYGRT